MLKNVDTGFQSERATWPQPSNCTRSHEATANRAIATDDREVLQQQIDPLLPAASLMLWRDTSGDVNQADVEIARLAWRYDGHVALAERSPNRIFKARHD